METTVSMHRGHDAIALFQSQKDQLTHAVMSGELAPTRFPSAYAEVADTFLSSLLEGATDGKTRGYALIAVGGYGRNELSPGSDLDLVLLHRGRRGYEKVAAQLWYAIWDAGLRLDHSVRTKGEVLQMARKDLKVILGLLDARVVAGDARLAAPVFDDVRALWQRDFRSYVPRFSESVEQRHESAGELAFLLEPDLKQSSGGIRDITALRSLAVAMPQLAPLTDALSVLDAERVIISTRVALQCETKSATDRLALQEQDEVAAILFFESADALMAKVAEAGRTISVASAEGWRRVHAAIGSRPVLHGAGGAVGPGITFADGEIALTDEARPAEDETLLVRVALAAAQRHALIDHGSIDRLSEASLRPSEPWSKQIRESFVALLGTGDALIPTVEALDQQHLFELLIPEWRAVRNRPQRNAYHRYTVDRHLLEAVARAAEHIDRVERPDLLLMGALLHDIGKGFPGDHTEVGKDIAVRIGTRMGFSEDDIDTLVRLIAFHLLLPEVATRRDLEDPATAAVVARLVGDRRTLALLAAVTAADGQATGTSAWGPWKAELVSRLVERVGAVIDGHPPVEVPESVPTPEELELLGQGAVAVRATGHRVTVIAPDQPGLFASVTGVLSVNGCNVRRATVAIGAPGMAIETFDVESEFDRLPNESALEEAIKSAVNGTYSITDRLAEQTKTYAHVRRPRAARRAAVRVVIDNETSALATILEVRATDEIGLLYRITSAIADADLDIARALVDTVGHEVIDTFYVLEKSGEKVSPGRAGEIYEQMSALFNHGD